MFTKFARLAAYALRQWRLLVAILLLTGGSVVLGVLQPWPLKILVDNALGSSPLPATLTWLSEAGTGGLILLTAGAYLVIFAIASGLDAALSYAWTRAGQSMVYDLAADLFRRLQRMSLLSHFKRPIGDSLSRLSGDAYCLYTLTEALLVSPLRQLITVAVVAGVAWQLSPVLTLLMLVVAPGLVLSARYFGSLIAERARAGRVAQSRLTSLVHQTLGAMPMVQAFHRGDANTLRFSEQSAAALAISKQSALVSGMFGVTNASILALGYGVVLYAGVRHVLAGELTIGGLLVLLAYLQTLQGAAGGVLGIFAQLKSAEASVDRVLEILDSREEVREASDAVVLPREAQRGQVRWEVVRFGYEPGRAVLDGVSLEVKPGETVALVGATGAGKSTLASLVLRFFDPWEGRVLVNGVDVRSATLASLRAEIGLVLQEPFLLPLTAAENIAYGRPEVAREEIEAAARAANAHGFIENLPQGYDTVIGERGATLSGGERQRLSIARALLKNAPILILDEPTSSLDASTERLVMEALERLMAGRTTLIIAHRLSTVRRADRIVVLEHGRIAESGTHAELLAANGRYRQLHLAQWGAPRKIAEIE